jgi:hypothetical protein
MAKYLKDMSHRRRIRLGVTELLVDEAEDGHARLGLAAEAPAGEQFASEGGEERAVPRG